MEAGSEAGVVGDYEEGRSMVSWVDPWHLQLLGSSWSRFTRPHLKQAARKAALIPLSCGQWGSPRRGATCPNGVPANTENMVAVTVAVTAGAGFPPPAARNGTRAPTPTDSVWVPWMEYRFGKLVVDFVRLIY